MQRKRYKLTLNGVHTDQSFRKAKFSANRETLKDPKDKIRELSSKCHDSRSIHNMLSTRSKRSARWSVQSFWRAAQLTVRNATRETVMLPRAASVREKTSSSSSGSDEDIGMWIRTNCNSFPCLLERTAFCLRNAPHRWWNPGECLFNIRTDQVKVKKRAVVRRCVCDICQHTAVMIHTRVCVTRLTLTLGSERV